MVRELFVDTNVLLGITFFSDRWFREARPVYDNDHEIHASELVVYEYCCSPRPFRDPPEDPSELDIDWTLDRGLVGRLRNRLSKPYREYRGTIRRLPDDDLTLERAVEEFIGLFEIRAEAEPQIRAEFEKEFADKAITRQYITEFASELIDKIINASEVMKKMLAKRVHLHDSKYHVANGDRQRWEDFPDHPPKEPDLSIIIDSTQVIQENSVNTVLSGDSDLLALQKIANTYFDFSILSIADEYSVKSQPQVDH